MQLICDKTGNGMWFICVKRESTNCEPTFKCHVLSGANSWIVARHIGHSASCTTQEEQKPLWPQGSSRTDALLSKHRVHESSRTLSFRNCSRWMCLPWNRREITKLILIHQHIVNQLNTLINQGLKKCILVQLNFVIIKTFGSRGYKVSDQIYLANYKWWIRKDIREELVTT